MCWRCKLASAATNWGADFSTRFLPQAVRIVTAIRHTQNRQITTLPVSGDDIGSFFREKDRSSASSSAATQWIPRAVLLDMEPKVIDSLVRSRRHVDKIQNSCARRSTDFSKKDRAATARPTLPWRYDANRTVCHQVGSGNNWALGYNIHGAKFGAAAMNVIRREMECSGSLWSREFGLGSVRVTSRSSWMPIRAKASLA